MQDILDELIELFADLVMNSEPGSRHLYYPSLDSLAFLADSRPRPFPSPGGPRLAERGLLKIGDFLAEVASRGPRAQRSFPEACRVVAERGLQARCRELSRAIEALADGNQARGRPGV
jgi:hypothetical protein